MPEYGEPWSEEEGFDQIVDREGDIIFASLGLVNYELRDRIVACVNVCRSLTNKDLLDGTTVLVTLEKIDKLRRQRDRLLDLAKLALEDMEARKRASTMSYETVLDENIAAARKTIKETEEKCG